TIGGRYPGKRCWASAPSGEASDVPKRPNRACHLAPTVRRRRAVAACAGERNNIANKSLSTLPIDVPRKEKNILAAKRILFRDDEASIRITLLPAMEKGG